MEKNLKRIEELKTFMGGDNEDVTIFPKAIEHMKYIVEQCEKYSLPQPDIFPWAGGNGVQAEWEYDWYLEVDSCDKGVSVFILKGKDYDNSISFNLYDIEDAFHMIKMFIRNVVDMNKSRW